MAISCGRQVVTHAKLVYLPVEFPAFLYDLPLTNYKDNEISNGKTGWVIYAVYIYLFKMHFV